MNVATLLQLINEQHGTAFELLERYSSGEQGAFAIADQDGRRYVLKWEADEGFPDRLKEVSLVTETLRKVGYPAPRYHLIDYVAGIQLRDSGSPTRSADEGGNSAGAATIAGTQRTANRTGNFHAFKTGLDPSLIPCWREVMGSVSSTRYAPTPL